MVSNFDLQTTNSTVDVDDTILPSQNINVPHEKIRYVFCYCFIVFGSLLPYKGLLFLPSHYSFHSRCGTLAKISCNGRAAERLRPFDEFNNGVVITHRPLCTEELYEVGDLYFLRYCTAIIRKIIVLGIMYCLFQLIIRFELID